MANTKGTSVINQPQAGGAQSGLGEKFSPDLFSGTGNFSIPVAVPSGRNNFHPQLTLSYSSGNGNGVYGSGWSLSIPGVMRKTSKGIPVYEDRTDIFILSGAEDLVPVQAETGTEEGPAGPIGYERTYYRPRTEGLYARIIRHKKTNGEHYWEVRSKDGLTSWYGSPGYVSDDPAVIANPEKRNAIFSWCLTRTEDLFGNEIIYDYGRDLVVDPSGRSYDQVYLTKIRYCKYISDTEEKYMCEVRFVYEERPDPFSTYKQGFEVRTTRRCTAIETYTNAESLIKVKTLHLNYAETLPLNGSSQLVSVSVEGHNGSESEFMPPLEFGYSEFDPFKRVLEEIKGPIPFNSIGEPGFELVDVSGNGLPDLLQLNGTARYWTNKGNGKFSPPRELNLAPSVQLGSPGVQLIDANGDGRTDLMVNNGQLAGYFPGAFHKVWDNKNFRPYEKLPSFSFADPEVQLIDLDGDGITDVLRNGARFECFYNDPVKGFYKVRTAEKTFANFSFADPRIRFADMTGDGMQDIVLISSGRVQYWPNMGYGRFGQKVNMKNAPVFPEQYEPSQVLLADLDGDGQADIVFVENNKITLYVNQSGNGFSAPVKIANTPRVLNTRAVRVTDIKGTGQAGVLWSFGPDAGTPGKMYFLDLTNGNKPYVLEEMKNNLGSLTRVKYGSSVYHYLRDEANPLTRWKTDLPFPVLVVNRVESHDLLTGGKLVTEYNYHNGYWDGLEREFRGFAHVDAVDTESFERYNVQDLFAGEEVNTVSAVHYSPPVLTKSWFNVGPVGDSYSNWKEPDFSDEYWAGDTSVFDRPAEMKNLLASLPRRARRDALRTLRGTLLRSEVYALDGTELQDIPYTVTESQSSLRLVFDPSQLPDPLWAENSGYWAGGGYVFFPFGLAQRTSAYERGNDPKHSYSFTKEYDAYGQPLGQLSVGLPRGSSQTGGANGNYLATFAITEFIYKDSGAGIYMVNRSKRSISYDATTSAIGKNVFQLRDEIFTDASSLPVIGCTLTYYDGDAFTGLAYGEIGNFGVAVRSESLVITEEIVTDAYGSNTPPCFTSSPGWSGSEYPAYFESYLQNGDVYIGYKDRREDAPDHIPGWYAEGPRMKFDFQTEEEYYGLLLESKDMFDTLASIEYDDYHFLPVNSKSWIDGTNYLETSAEYDYRLFKPARIIDENEKISVFDYSPLGLLRAVALIGDGTEGDYKGSSGGFYDRYEPSSVLEYDFFAFKNSGDPVYVKTSSRELHYQQSPDSPTITKIEFSDGFGRLIQIRAQAEDVIFGNSTFGSSGLPADQSTANADAVGMERESTDPLNVVVSGWKIYNNKGKVVEQYEPFFDSGFDYMLPDLLGVKIKIFYDAIGRPVKTLNPDNSQQWIIFGKPDAINDPPDPAGNGGGTYTPNAWENYTYDPNDLASISNVPNNNVDPSHYFTPKRTVVDALGRTILTTEFSDNSNYADTIDMRYAYDIRGNLLTVTDPYGRIVFEHVYDLSTAGENESLPPLWTRQLDKGESTAVFDAAGKPIDTLDAKGGATFFAYDTLSRIVKSWAKNKSADDITLRGVSIYGDSAGLTNPQYDGLKGKIYELYDEAGKQQFSAYDFKGNLLSKSRNVIDSSVLKSYLDSYITFIVDWTDFPSILDSFDYETDMEYDALNRITSLQLPSNVASDRHYIIPTYNRAGNLKAVAYKGDNYVKDIAYNARGQRILIAYGNDVMTRYVYDPLTFKLLRQRSEKYTYSAVDHVLTYAYDSGTVKQDDGFNTDLVGNIVKILTRVTDCGISGTTLGSDALDREFEYDSMYRLTYANGRESDTQDENDYLYTDAPAAPVPSAGDVRAYSRTYEYDKVGNIQLMVQAGTNGFTRDFAYNDNSNTIFKIFNGVGSALTAYSYDECGNITVDNESRRYKWDAANRLICYYNQAGGTPTVFTQYDYSGNDRVSKLVRTGTDVAPIYERTIYIDGIFEYVRLEETSTTYEKNYVHIMDDSARIAEIRVGDVFPDDISNNVVYILGDQIGSSLVRLDTSGSVIDTEEYYPFGDSSLRTWTYKRYRYVGKERDQESGMYYYGARYYVAWTCRFISIDPMADKYAQLSPYNYADNNPINDFDIDGMQNNNSSTSPQPGPKTEISQPDNTSVSNNNKIIADNINLEGGQKGIHFKLTIDKTIKGAPEEINKKNFVQINVNTVQNYNMVVGDKFAGLLFKELIKNGTIEDDAEVILKLKSAGTEIPDAKGENVFFNYDLTVKSKNNNFTIPIQISGGQIVRFQGSHPIDYPLALMGSGVYSQLFKKALVQSIENSLIQQALIEQMKVVQKISLLSKTQQGEISTVVGAVNKKTGQVAVGIKWRGMGDKVCAEDIVVEMLGGKSEDIIFTSAFRPRNQIFINVCPRCQTKYSPQQFQPGTKFDP